MSNIQKNWCLISFVFIILFTGLVFVAPSTAQAINIIEYSNTLSDSGPEANSNHTLGFTILTELSPGSSFEITPPPGFEVINALEFAERNVELTVDGVVRVSGDTLEPGQDLVEITTGSPGFIRYTLSPDLGIAADSRLELKIGNQTSVALPSREVFDLINGTTTAPGDISPITNSGVRGVHEVKLEVFDGSLVADADFVIFLVDKVSIPNIDSTETIPPLRFNGAPTSSVGGTTLSVEISLETDEFAFCRYSVVPDVDFSAMTSFFTNSGLIFHSSVVVVVPDTLATFYVRCIDDEGNFNIDDFLIQFQVNPVPTGESNTDGETDGDGTGTGNSGGGDGGGGGGTTGESDGEQPTTGGSSGSGGSGGGGGGGSGSDSGSSAGGGFESTDAPFRSGDGRVIISGYAFPNSTVGFLVDGNFFDTTRSNSSGAYSVTLDEIARGVYTFGVFGEDPDDERSSVFSTSFTVTGARTSALSNINVAPSVNVVPDPVDPGETLVISGYALPDSVVTIENGRLNQTMETFTANAGGDGSWSLTLDTSSFARDTYQVRAKSEQEDGRTTQFSDFEFYGVGQNADVPINADLNRDGSVNLIDFSILLFWWNSNGGDSDPPADINQDGNVSLTDFSILLFNWTG